MAGNVDRGQIAHRHFVAVRVERDLGAEVGIVNDANVILRAAQIAGIFESHPGMSRLEEHRQNPPPQIDCPHALPHEQLPTVGRGFTGFVRGGKRCPEGVVQAGAFVR